MTINLLDMLQSAVAPEIIKQATTYLGESHSSIQSSVEAIMPTLVGGLMQKGATSEGANTLLNLINTGPSIEPSMLTNLSGLFSGGERTGTLLGIGGTLIKTLFGDRAAGINSALSSMNNMKAGSGGSLMAMVTPLLFGMLKNYVSTHKLDAGGLMKMLSSQREYVAPALSEKLTAALGLGPVAAFLGNTPGGAISAEPRTTDTARKGATSTTAPANEVAMNARNALNTARPVGHDAGDGSSIWKKILPIVLLVAAAVIAIPYLMKTFGASQSSSTVKKTDATSQAPAPAPAPAPAADPPKPAADATKDMPANAAPAMPAGPDANPSAMAKPMPAQTTAAGLKSYALPGGGKLDVAPNSFAGKLLAYLAGSGGNAKQTFNLDHVRFGMDSTDLESGAMQELQQAAAILKAYPNVNVRVDGHTDREGDPGYNKVLSSRRTDVVKNQLISLGVAANRITTGSFGATRPIAPNTTEAGRAKNRRVEITVTKR
jgi:OmpA-OmpF porin, OOP family